MLSLTCDHFIVNTAVQPPIKMGLTALKVRPGFAAVLHGSLLPCPVPQCGMRLLRRVIFSCSAQLCLLVQFAHGNCVRCRLAFRTHSCP